MRGRKAVPIELTEEERKHLKHITRCYTLPHREVLRAKSMLLANEGVGNTEIARRLETHPNIVGKWRKRFLKDREKGLKDLPRPGAPSAFSPCGETQVH
jgi:transposase